MELNGDFMMSMTLLLSEVIIIAMNEMSFEDQLFLDYVLDRWSSLCREGHLKCKEIFVIHNFRCTKNAKERDALFEVRSI